MGTEKCPEPEITFSVNDSHVTLLINNANLREVRELDVVVLVVCYVCPD